MHGMEMVTLAQCVGSFIELPSIPVHVPYCSARTYTDAL